MPARLSMNDAEFESKLSPLDRKLSHEFNEQAVVNARKRFDSEDNVFVGFSFVSPDAALHFQTLETRNLLEEDALPNEPPNSNLPEGQIDSDAIDQLSLFVCDSAEEVAKQDQEQLNGEASEQLGLDNEKISSDQLEEAGRETKKFEKPLETEAKTEVKVESAPEQIELMVKQSQDATNKSEKAIHNSHLYQPSSAHPNEKHFKFSKNHSLDNFAHTQTYETHLHALDPYMQFPHSMFYPAHSRHILPFQAHTVGRQFVPWQKTMGVPASNAGQSEKPVPVSQKSKLNPLAAEWKPSWA